MQQDAGTIRVFVALLISPEARQVLEQAMTRLQSAIPRGVKWVDPAGIHLTLKFLGNIPTGKVDSVFDAMRQSAQGSQPFALRLDGLGVFPNRNSPRVLWAGVSGDMEYLGALQEKVEQALRQTGFAAENRPFRPHLTLGRLRESAPPPLIRQPGEVMATATLPPSQPWQVDSIHLIRSVLTPSGAIYTSLGACFFEDNRSHG